MDGAVHMRCVFVWNDSTTHLSLVLGHIGVFLVVKSMRCV